MILRILLTAFVVVMSYTFVQANPMSLWQEYDPDQGDFREQIVKEQVIHNGVRLKESYISAYVLGEEIRVYCRYAVKDGAKNVPGLLRTHGWMSTAHLPMQFVEDGWALMAFDYCGKAGKRQNYTKYPEKLSHGNMDRKHGFHVASRLPDGKQITNPKQTSKYLWYAIQRRVLSYLIAQKEVDKQKIGASGYSEGGSLMWNLATDPRVKAVVAHFGIGWNEYYRSKRVWLFDDRPHPEIASGEKIFLSKIAPQAHAPHTKAAALWLNGTNDHHGGHERGEQTFKSFPKNVPWAFAHQPRGHHNTKDIIQNEKLWLDKHVRGKAVDWARPTQKTSIGLDKDGIPEFKVVPENSQQVVSVDAYYCLADPMSYGRAWRDAKIAKNGDSWVAKMPVMNVDEYVFAFANITYKNGIVLSAPFTAAIPSKLGKAKATDRASLRISSGTGAWNNVAALKGKGGEDCFRVLSNHGANNDAFSDPKWEAPANAELAVKFYCTEPQQILFTVNNAFDATVDLAASNEWQMVSLPAELFISKSNGDVMGNWSNTDTLRIRPAKDSGSDITKVLFAKFEWTSPMKIPKGQRVYLTSDMATRINSFGKPNNNRAWQGTPISIGGKQYKRGIGVHSDTGLHYHFNGEFEKMHVIPGPDDAHSGKVEMKIYLDGKVVYSSGEVHRRQKVERKPVELKLHGVRTMVLEVISSDGDRHRGGDHASWADLYVERPSDIAFSPQKVSHAPTLVPKDKLEPFLQEYCIDCHGKRKQEADVRFDQIAWEIDNNDIAQRWQDVLDQVNGGDMPPKDENQPFDDETSEFLDVLTQTVITARQRLTDHGGEITMRRLNRREYSATVRDLFGFNVNPYDIPEDGEFEHFDTVGSEQLFTSQHYEKYLALGEQVANEGVKWNTKARERPSVNSYDPEERFNERLRADVAEKKRRKKLLDAGKTWQEAGFKDEGEMKTLLSQWHGRYELPLKYLSYPQVNSGVYLSDIAKRVDYHRHTDLRGDYVIRINGGVVGEPDDIRKIIRLEDNNGILGTLKMTGSPLIPGTVELTTRQFMNQRLLGFKISENLPNFAENSQKGYRGRIQGNENIDDHWSSIWINWIQIDGPFYPAFRPKFEEILFPGRPLEGRPVGWGKDERTKEIIEQFAYEAFRRKKPAKQYVDRLYELYKLNRAEGKKYEHALADVMSIILASPGFLYIQEESSEKGIYLDQRELAVRLSYYIWSSPPDEELYQADLLDPDVFEQQMERLLDDERAESFRKGFMSQWAEFDRFDAITIDEKEYYRYNKGVQDSAKKEVIAFFTTMLEENLPVTNLIDSDFATINPTLAVHYGLDGVEVDNDDFVKVALPADSPRGGLMTQAAFLTTGSNGERSSPVIRGALVMEKLLDDKPAPPPPNVPELSAASDKPKTNREMVIAHQEQAVCASCHKKMDVIGFGLENFDPVGAWRDVERVGRENVVIEPGGTLPDGSKFADVHQLKEVLLEHEQDLARGIVESMLTYALGRSIEFSDADDVEEILASVAEDGYRMRDIVKAVATSQLFHKR